jgi:hypothetical protein
LIFKGFSKPPRSRFHLFRRKSRVADAAASGNPRTGLHNVIQVCDNAAAAKR